MIIRFPTRRIAAVLICHAREGGWLVIAPRGAWLCGSRAEAHRAARWLARNVGGLPIREMSN
jgi:hypothetical protein